VVPGVLDAGRLARMNAALDDADGPEISEPTTNDPNKSRFQFLDRGADFHSLIDDPQTLPLLQEFIGPNLRLDHAYGMSMSSAGAAGGEGLHLGGGMFQHGSYYVTHGERIHNGLLVVSFALCDVPKGVGGFCCVPGSHKQLVATPPSLRGTDAANGHRSNTIVVQPELKAGDALFFTEALRHGTLAWTEPRWERRGLLLKYCPHYMAYSPTPIDYSEWPSKDALSEQQQGLLERAYVWERPNL
jgi:hypothetical protein